MNIEEFSAEWVKATTPKKNGKLPKIFISNKHSCDYFNEKMSVEEQQDLVSLVYEKVYTQIISKEIEILKTIKRYMENSIINHLTNEIIKSKTKKNSTKMKPNLPEFQDFTLNDFSIIEIGDEYFYNVSINEEAKKILENYYLYMKRKNQKRADAIMLYYTKTVNKKQLAEALGISQQLFITWLKRFKVFAAEEAQKLKEKYEKENQTIWN